MNSEQRKELRYQRRKAKRYNNKIKNMKYLGSFDDIFSYTNLYESFKYCKTGVRWKCSIQSYEANLPVNTYNLYSKLKNRTWKSKGFTTFNICERGKMRTIQSVHISERCIQRTFCDNYLVPITTPSLIYDNGASLKNKGIDFSLNRLKHHLLKHYNKYGNEGYIITIDFSNYFGNISHKVLFEQMDNLFIDDKLKDLYHQLINAFSSGVGLGSQVSQITAVAFANKIDHYFKDKLGIKGYARYMDDIYIIEKDLIKVKEYINIVKKLCVELNIVLKDEKVKINKIKHGFTFLKKRFLLTEHGNVIIRLSRKSVFACKRRLNKMKEKMLSGKLSYNDVYNSYISWRESVKKYKTYKVVQRMDNYFNKLFIHPFIIGSQL